jgi:hypothetical protein
VIAVKSWSGSQAYLVLVFSIFPPAPERKIALSDSDGIEYTDIEVVVEMDGDIRETVNLVKTLERPLAKGGRNE